MRNTSTTIDTVGEDEVARFFELSGKSRRAQQLAIDRLWRRMQNIRMDRKLPPLTRVKLGPRLRYVYKQAALEEWFRMLADSE